MELLSRIYVKMNLQSSGFNYFHALTFTRHISNSLELFTENDHTNSLVLTSLNFDLYKFHSNPKVLNL